MAQTTRKPKVIVSGIMFWYPLAGVAYQFLHYLLGLRRLGYDVWYVEDSARLVYDPTINDFNPDASGNITAIQPLLKMHGFGDHWAFRGNYPNGKCYGLTEPEILKLYRESAALLNVTGAQELREEHTVCPCKIYVESDPFAWQVRIANDDAEAIDHVGAHDLHFTFGENIGEPDCDIPTDRYNWMTTRQPVILDLWEREDQAEGKVYNTITTWKNEGREVTYRGETY
jgi:hypothetical protein